MPDVGLPATTAAAGHRQGWVLLTLCLGVLVAQVDTSVVNLAIQPIGTAFRASVAGLQWVLDGYNLSYAVLLLSGGLVADLYGRRLVFQAGAALLGLAAPRRGGIGAAAVRLGVLSDFATVGSPGQSGWYASNDCGRNCNRRMRTVDAGDDTSWPAPRGG